MPTRRQMTVRRAALVGQVIVATSLFLAAVVSVGCRTSPSVDPAVRGPIDDYFRAFKTFDATLAASVSSPEMRAEMPGTPEEMVGKMRASSGRYGPIQGWSIDSASVDADNGQALVTVRVTSQKVIHVLEVDLRRYEDGWRIYGVTQKDAVRNPAYERSSPGDIGQGNPFGGTIK